MTEIERAGCHRTLSYPKGKRPTGVADGALMFIGRLTRDAGVNDIRIFGRACAYAHEPGADDESALDTARRGWRVTWPHYVRVHGAEFLAGTMGDGISLNELMAALGADAFFPTQRNRAFNLQHQPPLPRNENPRTAYRQQPAVELSQQGQAWLAQRLQAAFTQHGCVHQSELDAIA